MATGRYAAAPDTNPAIPGDPGPAPADPAPAPAPDTTVHPANPAAYIKALVAMLVAGLGVLYQAWGDGTVTPQEWIDVAQTALVAGAAVYGFPNFPTRP